MDEKDYTINQIHNEITKLKKQARVDFRNGSCDEDYGRLKAFEECLEVIDGYRRNC